MTEEPSQEEKNKYCEELSQFIENAEKYVKDACAFLNWDFDQIAQNNEEYMLCPFNIGHRVPKRSLEKHLVKCEWNTLGYTKDCIPLPDSFLSLESPSSIKFDMELQHKVLTAAKQQNPELNIGDEEKLIPQTSDRLISDFTSDERKAMYEYVISNTVAPDIGEDIKDINKPEKSNETRSTPILELLAQERNLKRRRAKHRGIHTNKKSHTEILREIVEQQMEMYKEHISEKLGVSTTESASDSNQMKINDLNSEQNVIKSSEDIFCNYEPDDYKKQDYENKYNTKSVEKFDRNSKYFHDRSYSTSHKHNSYYKQYESSNFYGKHFHDKNHSRERHSSKNYSSYDKKDYHDKKHDIVSRNRKRSRSASNEKKFDEESEYTSKEGRSSNKHKKHDKHKKEKSYNNDGEKKHKSSKHKREKHRSRSGNR